VQVNGARRASVCPHLTNISFGFVEGESLMMACKEIAMSSGSACTSASLEPSYVLKGLGVGDDLAHSSPHQPGPLHTEEEVDYAIDAIVTAVKKLRELSPLYDMHNEGIDITKIEWQAPLSRTHHGPD
jgi:cysteine desulfurase